jgi:ATP adenylyltransferase
MKFLYAPWRESYIKGDTSGKQEDSHSDECVFCAQYNSDKDEDNLILHRYENFYVVLNAFPYNAGHVLIVSDAHVPDLQSFTKDQRSELMEIVTSTLGILKKELACEGFNIGINVGKAAGAGIPSHFHQHIIPRWQGDTNFLPTVSDTKHISTDLIKLYKRLKTYYKGK